MIINLTPHAIHLVGHDGTVVAEIPSSVGEEGFELPRVSLETREVGSVDATLPDGSFLRVPLRWNRGGKVTGLPAPEPGVTFVVSRAVCEAAPERADLVYPDDTVRDERGRIIGCRAFGSAARCWEVEYGEGA